MTRAARPRTITLERRLDAPIEDVWEMWTTTDGIEAWWGPDGFAVTVHHLELRAGGELRYAMTAVAPDQIAFMKRAGMPVTTEARVTFTEVTAPRRLAYVHLADFIPGVAPYDVAHVVELHADGDATRLVLTFDAMHDETWTERAAMGWDNELGKLVHQLAARAR